MAEKATQATHNRARAWRALRRLEPLIAVTLFAAALWVIHRELGRYSWRDVADALSALPAWKIGTALGITLFNFTVLTGYDTLGLRYVGHPLAYRRSAFASFVGYAFSNTLGFPLLTSAPLRFRLYSAWGLTLVEIRNLVAFYTASFWLGFFTLAGIVTAMEPLHIRALMPMPDWAARPVAAALLAVPLGYLALTILRRVPMRLGSLAIPVPRPTIAAGTIAVATLDWAANVGALYVLLPEGHGIGFAGFAATYLLAQVAGLVSHVPGGLGVFEAVIMGLLPSGLPEGAALGSLLAFRLIFYFLPLVVAACVLAAYEFRERARGVRVPAARGAAKTYSRDAWVDDSE